MAGQQVAPGPVADPCGVLGRAHDVGEEHRPQVACTAGLAPSHRGSVGAGWSAGEGLTAELGSAQASAREERDTEEDERTLSDQAHD